MVVRNGSNDKIWDASALYVNRTVNPITLSHVESEIDETLYTLEKTQEIVEYVINNTPWEVQGDHGLTQKFDTSITFWTFWNSLGSNRIVIFYSSSGRIYRV